jgi:hypothetical protein
MSHDLEITLINVAILLAVFASAVSNWRISRSIKRDLQIRRALESIDPKPWHKDLPPDYWMP